MKHVTITIIGGILLLMSVPASALIEIGPGFKSSVIGHHMEYIEDPDGDMVFAQALSATNWNAWHKDAVNFGFTPSSYWLRFKIVNTTTTSSEFLFEISYGMLDSIQLYRPDGLGGYSIYETGDHLPFSHREIENVGFVFKMNQPPGEATYYLRIQTTSSLNFTPVISSLQSYFGKLNREQPVIWIYYGLMIIMVVYNLFIFFSSRDRSYLFYVLFISTWIILQMCLNGYAFQYLWPNMTWWANNSLPFFITLTYVTVSFFFIFYLETKTRYLFYHRVMLFTTVIPGLILSGVSLIVPYGLAIKMATVFAGVAAFILYGSGIILVIQGSRQARFMIIAFTGLVLGIMLYVLKTFGVLPTNFLTQWSIQIGSSLVVVLLSLGLADKINLMRRDLQRLLDEQKLSEKMTRERADFLEGIVQTVNIISDDFIKVSRELDEISTTFSQLSMEQATTSEQMSATYEELVSSTERIHGSNLSQQSEGERSKKLVDELSTAQKSMIRESMQVAKSVDEISKAAKMTEESLRSMTERMSVINSGGNEIDQFVMMIDDISDKINLLSLNAAIEAARAGEYGRGFAVVADEIGKLAQATSDNSKNIANRIKGIIVDIGEGTALVGNTKNSTDVIFSMVGTISAGIDAVRDLMAKQNTALDLVVKQANVIDSLSREVVVSTQEQLNSMMQTMHTIERLAEMASEISNANLRIRDFVVSISANSDKLATVVGSRA
jgi:methyl-accepting chemotaxis protein